MWLRGSKGGVGRWYVCWGLKGESYNVELYVTLNGLAKWMINKVYRDIPVLRIGRMVITEDGPVEKEHWGSRGEFLEWVKPLVTFEIPRSEGEP